jgi:nitrite reductase/ring-hydroxylating ferredoxin subunit
MQSFDTEHDDTTTRSSAHAVVSLDNADHLPAGSGARIALPNGDDLAVFNVNGEYYAIENSCPHKGAPLSDGQLCGYVIECSLHGWQFDVRTGECLTVPDRVRTYQVKNDMGVLRIEL